MDFMSNDITFGDFDNLSQDDVVYQILYGPRQTVSSGVEFPWDSKPEYYNYGESQDRENYVEPHKELQYLGESMPDQQDSGINMLNSLPVNNENFAEFNYQQDDTDHIRSNSPLSKPYERRNKKRRPKDYYEKLQQEIEAERTQQIKSPVCHEETERSDRLAHGDVSYSSQSERDTVTEQYMPPEEVYYAQNYATSSNQIQHTTNYQSNDNVDAITENISTVDLSSDSFSHSHMVHTSHEHYPQPSQPSLYPSQSQMSSHSSQLPLYQQQEWTMDQSSHYSQNLSDTSENTQVHTSYIDMSTTEPQIGSIPSGHIETKQEVTDADHIQQNVLESQSENIVDFASYPPLQPTSNNIPIGAPINKQESPEPNNLGKNVQENLKHQEESSGEQTASAWGKPKTWANLFKEGSSSSVIYVKNGNYVDEDYPTINQDNDPKQKQVEEMSPVPAIHDSAAEILGDLFCQYKIVHSQVGLQPRGLINRGNWCYINATLQALISCPPFYNLMKKIPIYPPIQRGPTSTPILDSIVKFVSEFTPCARSTDRGKNKKPPELPPGPTFEPTYVYRMLQLLQDNATFKLGKQEDAEEFLSCILDGMHEEMLACMRVNKGEAAKECETNGILDNSGEEDLDADSWEQVGPKKKSVLTRKNDFAVSPLADIFVGYVRSAVFRTTSKDSATVEPFFTLKLDIQSEKVSTVREALERMVSKESVSGFTCSKTNAEMEITKRLSLEQLPPVLILHLKYFVYNKDGGSQKLIKDVNFTVDLEITKDLLSPNVKNKYLPHQRIYKLFAVVYHHGKKATGGHYTTAVFHPAINRWVNFDDSIVKIVPVTSVLQFSAPRVPYLLYYRRVDLH